MIKLKIEFLNNKLFKYFSKFRKLINTIKLYINKRIINKKK
jgi:hypothetical protein